MKSLKLDHEKDIWNTGVNCVCGIDEVGRGAIAGPLVVGCVGFSSDVVLPNDVCIHDSKILTQRRRNEAYIWITESCLFYGLGEVDNAYIDSKGIMESLCRAKQIAFDQAKEMLARNARNAEINRVMIDGNDNHVLKGIPKSSQVNIIRGDSQVFSIASASIVAKVYRDSLMRSYSLYPENEVYNWSNNSGYGTARHIQAIKSYGLSKLHRRTFVQKYV